ncbi:biotin/lipoyl-binding protein [Anaerofilum sp. BX8]|uniref:Biotin/lipoyl-binding protein n=1 Tax=Anaerofilum hominis TaxID=2763016 RepID=A0A923L0A5_9FIRM|nr:HlyD family efflux transporter periplasmic adaptor subunit [Anaerofilum hominis]MBC5580115.1 biotin/lipoyl-binding protein [Anaerofilum hominis]
MKWLEFKERSRALAARLPRPAEDSQRRALGNILRFFSLMLVFTLVARGAAAATLPRVGLSRPAAGEIVQALQAGGTVQAADPLGVAAPAGLTVKKWLAQPGQKIKEGDPLLQLDGEEAAEALARAELELERMRLELQKLLDGVQVDTGALSGAATALERAKADAESQRAAAQAAQAGAQSALDAAAADAAAKAVELDALRTQQDPPASGEQLAAAEAALAEADARREQAAGALKEAKEQAAAADLSAGRSVSDAQSAWDAAAKAQREAEKQAGYTRRDNEISAAALRLDIREKEDAARALRALREADGILAAPGAGTVVGLDAAAGTRTGEAPAAWLAPEDSGFEVVFQVTEKEAKKMAPGSAVRAESAGKTINGTVASLAAADENGMVTVRAALEGGSALRPGQSALVTAELSRQNYTACLPVGAIRSDSRGDYVLAMEQRQTVLGFENILVRVPVEVVESGGELAAVEGVIAPGSRIVSESDKPVSEGDRVRELDT